MRRSDPRATSISRQLNASACVVPPGWQERRTSTLLDRGLLAVGAGSGLVAYTPLGAELLDRLETECVNELVSAGYDALQLPHIMADEDLLGGEEVGEQFAGKFIGLSKPFVGQHLINSPETLIARLTKGFELSHRALPLRLAYRTSIFRNMPETRSFLTCREFRVVGCLALMPSGAVSCDMKAEIGQTSEAVSRVAAGWGVLTADVGKEGVIELGYLDAAEGDLRVYSDGVRQRALSLSIGYHYGKDIDFPATYRAADNVLHRPQSTTMALCTNRLMYSAFDATRDEHGFALTPAARPYDVMVLPRAANDMPAAADVADRLADDGLRAALDDRVNRKVGPRSDFAWYVGTPVCLVVHRGLGILVRRGSTPDFSAAAPLSAAAAEVGRRIATDLMNRTSPSRAVWKSQRIAEEQI